MIIPLYKGVPTRVMGWIQQVQGKRSISGICSFIWVIDGSPSTDVMPTRTILTMVTLYAICYKIFSGTKCLNSTRIESYNAGSAS